MERYANLGRDSGVLSFEIGLDFIVVEFRKGGSYLYTYRLPGKFHVEQMKGLAQRGEGLGTYINKYVGKRYEQKLI